MDRNKIDDLIAQLSQIEADINALKRRITELEEEVMRIKKDNQRLLGELQRTRTVRYGKNNFSSSLPTFLCSLL